MSKKKKQKQKIKSLKNSRSVARATANLERVKRADVVMELIVRADKANDADRTIPVVIATEKPIPGLDRDWNIVDQVLLIEQKNVPGDISLIDSHDRSSIFNTFGSIINAEIGGGAKKQLEGLMSFAETQKGQDSYILYRDGHLRDVSINVYATKPVIRIEAGKTRTVKGRSFTAGGRPMDIFTDWKTSEVSGVIKGADDDAKVKRNLEKEKDMDFEKWLVERGHKLDELAEAERAKLHLEFLQELEATQRSEIETKVRAELEVKPDETKRTADPAPAGEGKIDIEKIVSDAVGRGMKDIREAEQTRRAAITKICRDDSQYDFPELERKAFDLGWDESQTKDAVLEATRKSLDSGIGAPAIHSKNNEINGQIVEDALIMRAGYEDIILSDKKNGEERAERADKHRSMSLIDVCRVVLQQDGQSVPFNSEEVMRAAFSTNSLPIILGNVAHKSLLKGYMAARDTWRVWCNIGSVSDFKTVTKARLTDTGELEEVNSAGEVKHGGTVEEYEQYSIATYAKQFTITRQDIINDDLGAFTRTPMRMGISANRLIPKLVYAHLLANGNMKDGTALFHADHSNLVTGSAYLLSVGLVALAKALETFRKQTDIANEIIDVTPATILCPPEAEAHALALITSKWLQSVGDGDVHGLATANPFVGQYKVAVENRLSNSNYTGYSATAWFLMGNPAEVDTVEVAFLNGKQTPTIERFPMGIDVLGIGYRVYHDTGVKALDHRGMVKLTGT